MTARRRSAAFPCGANLGDMPGTPLRPPSVSDVGGGGPSSESGLAWPGTFDAAATVERVWTDFVAALNLNMRMRVVHAPLLQQRIVARMPLHGLVDIEAYHRNVERLHLTLNALGFGVGRPEGTFYLWAVLPDEFRSEAEFRALAFEGPSPLLYLPGTLFGGDAYARCLRFSTCAPFAEIERACVRLREIVEARRPNSGATP